MPCQWSAKSGLLSGGWRLVLTGFFRNVTVLLGCVNRINCMFGRAVDGVQGERLGAGVAEVVLGACWDGTLVTRLDRMGVASQVGFSGTADEGENLIGVLMDFFADFSAHRNRHDHDLRVLTGPQDPSEVRVL